MSPLQKIKSQLAQLEVNPKRSLGQNFLIGPGVINRIVDKAKSCESRHLIEVGPGLGALTEFLAEIDPAIQLVELDKTFAGYWREKGMKVYEEDALKLNWQELQLEPNCLLVSNLPYQISSSLVIDRSLGPKNIDKMLLMFQKEVAQRILSQPKTKEYSFLTVVAQSFWKISLVLEAAPNEFYPAPKIASRVLSFQRKPVDEQLDKSFILMIKQAFLHRRKLLFKNLLPMGSSFGISAAELEEIFVNQQIDRKARAEELDPQGFIELYLTMNRVKSEH